MADVAFNNRVRVGGSGFTIFTYGGNPLAFAQQVAHTAPAPVGAGAQPIHPMDEPYAAQIVTPAAVGIGTLVFDLIELYDQKVWDRLAEGVRKAQNAFGGLSSNDIPLGGGPFDGAVDLLDVLIRQAEYDKPLNVVKFIRPPTLNGKPGKVMTEEYHGCVITNVADGETVEVGTLQLIKQVTVAYRFQARNGNLSKGFDYRNRAF